jgi:hypothetical protein
MRPNKRVGFDPSARAFAVAAKLTNTTQLVATNNLVLALKQQGLWSLITLLYPFVGGTAVAHSVNLKTPRSNTITWSGTITHNNQGIKSDGLTGWGETGMKFSDCSRYTSVYVTSQNTPEPSCELTVAHAEFGEPRLQLQANWSGFFTAIHGSYPADALTQAPQAGGGFFSSCSDGSTAYLARNSSVLTTKQGINRPLSQAITLRLLGSPDMPTYAKYSTKVLGCAIVMQPLTTSQHVALYNAIQTFQTALGRAV